MSESTLSTDQIVIISVCGVFILFLLYMIFGDSFKKYWKNRNALKEAKLRTKQLQSSSV